MLYANKSVCVRARLYIEIAARRNNTGSEGVPPKPEGSVHFERRDPRPEPMYLPKFYPRDYPFFELIEILVSPARRREGKNRCVAVRKKKGKRKKENDVESWFSKRESRSRKRPPFRRCILDGNKIGVPVHAGFKVFYGRAKRVSLVNGRANAFPRETRDFMNETHYRARVSTRCQ